MPDGDFKDIVDVQRWVNEQPNGFEDLETALRSNRWTGADRTMVVKFVEWRNQEMINWKKASEAWSKEQERDWQRRSVDAAERSASAAVNSAAHAKDATRWAKWAVVVATVALIVSVGAQIGRLIKAL